MPYFIHKINFRTLNSSLCTKCNFKINESVIKEGAPPSKRSVWKSVGVIMGPWGKWYCVDSGRYCISWSPSRGFHLCPRGIPNGQLIPTITTPDNSHTQYPYPPTTISPQLTFETPKFGIFSGGTFPGENFRGVKCQGENLLGAVVRVPVLCM